MSDIKTKQMPNNVEDFINNLPDEKRRSDCFTILKLMSAATQASPKMWGGSIVGFGEYHYKYESGREGDWFMVGFSPRKQNLTLYVVDGFPKYAELLGRLGKHKTGKSCLYINRLDDIDLDVLKELITQSVQSQQKG